MTLRLCEVARAALENGAPAAAELPQRALVESPRSEVRIEVLRAAARVAATQHVIIPVLVVGFALRAAADEAWQALADSSAKQVAAVNKHDAKSWAALFAEDATLVPAGQPIVTGGENIEKWGKGAAKVWNHLDVKREYSGSNGNVAWDTGSYTGNVNLPDGKAVDITGNYVFVLQKEDSASLIKVNTWNNNPPAQ